MKMADWEYLQAEALALAYCERLKDAAEGFQGIINRLTDLAIVDGPHGIAQALKERSEAMNPVVSQIRALITTLSGDAQKHIEKINQIDDFVYGGD